MTLLLALMTFGATNALAQTGLSGIYYIASDKGTEEEGNKFIYNNSTTANRFYIVPAKDPQLGDNRDAYYSEHYDT
jgi:hypothetical protein